MNTVLKLNGFELVAQRQVMNMLNKLCKNDPLSAHCYAIYYLTYEPGRTEMLLMVSDGNIKSYALVRYGGKFTIQDIYEVYVWNPTSNIVMEINIPSNKRINIQLYGKAFTNVEVIISHFKNLGFKKFYVEKFYDMICSHVEFKPSPTEKLAVRLREEHASLYKDLELERGIELSIDEAREILREYMHYGVIIDDALASIAARYVILPEVHVIGGVFTRGKYRGRGYAKAVVSALTREAITTGAYAGLHVEVDNEPALRIYRELGYRILRTRMWIFAYP